MHGSSGNTPIRRSISRAFDQIGDLLEIAADRGLVALRAPRVSEWSIGEQVEHLRKSDVTILEAVARLDTDSAAVGSPTIAGRFVLLSGFIPRGRGRAPAAVIPIEVDRDSLAAGLEAVRDGFADLRPQLGRLGASRATIRHPVLGHFTASQMLAFATIHHHHHLKIIRDIRRSAEP